MSGSTRRAFSTSRWREPRRMDGKMHKVWIYQRDFRLGARRDDPVRSGDEVEGYQETHKMLIEKVALNQKLDDAAFGKPAA